MGNRPFLTHYKKMIKMIKLYDLDKVQGSEKRVSICTICPHLVNAGKDQNDTG